MFMPKDKEEYFYVGFEKNGSDVSIRKGTNLVLFIKASAFEKTLKLLQHWQEK